jgi:hypothetical protein
MAMKFLLASILALGCSGVQPSEPTPEPSKESRSDRVVRVIKRELCVYLEASGHKGTVATIARMWACS